MELTHYGVLGMKWGVRRTPEQLGHKRVKKKVKQNMSDDRKEVQDMIKRGAKNLSNKELQTVLQRLNAEDQFKRLTSRKVQQKGETWTKQTMKRIGTATSVAVSAAVVAGGKKLVDVMMPYIKEGIKEGWERGALIRHSEDLLHYGVKGMKWGV